MSVRPSRRLIAAFLPLLMGVVDPAWAQPGATLSGSVRDQTGAALVSATISVRGTALGEATTDANGAFELLNLPAGEYEITAAMSGFNPSHRVVRLHSGETLAVSLILSVSIREQLVVTAAKSGSADIQSIPMAVSAVSNDHLTRLGTRTIEQAVSLLPAVTFTQNSTYGQLSIRGIGTNLVNAGNDPSSAMYIDGVYLARPAMAFVDLLDLERIEVLRGPQGTLYGRNAVGGALNLISKAPTNELQIAGRVRGGNLGELRGEARLSGPLKRNRVMGSIAVARGTRDGYVRDLEHPEHRLGGDNLTAARGQIRFVPGRSTDLLVSTDVSDQRGVPLTFNKVLQAKPGVIVSNPRDPREVRTSTLASARILQYGASVRLTTGLTPSTTLVSLSAFRRLENELLVDADVTELDLLTVRNRQRQHQWSEEVTLTHRQPRLTWIGGAFFFDEADRQTLEIDQAQARVRGLLDPRVTVGSAAGFGQATFDVSRSVAGIIGVRYTRERKEIANRGERQALPEMMSVPGSPYAYADSLTHSAWTPKFGVDLKWSPVTMVYGSATKGFKSGGFNHSSTQPVGGFAPESAWSYEGGLKRELMSGLARLNLALFQMDHTNMQVQTPIGIGVFDIRNASAATIRGVEVEGTARIGRGVAAGGHLTWLDATYDRYVAVGTDGVVGDVSGNRLNNAPEWAGRLWAEWNGNLRSSDLLSLTLDGTVQSTVFYTPFNDHIQRQGPFALLAASAEYGPGHRRWSVNVYARNLTDTEYIMATFATSPAAYGGRPGASRQWGVQGLWRR
jgi:iron complex outermembrane receptor protein